MEIGGSLQDDASQMIALIVLHLFLSEVLKMSVNLNPHRKIPEWEAKLWVLEARYGSIVKAPDDDADYLAMRKAVAKMFSANRSR
ncbi:hypothetical protein FD01_GL000825 [Lacticaseibacillus manihotivorans DSM 13343 = JCM 12514]|uniref:Uncharacterized protein n=2 Tax=Lacticaseibacillus TaxID=2759736 RepID=A0A0R1QK65_9LACO|nr:hypothetical protein FD01_GL000825 [Lacticaseibacillus manihotivorans DSM 13343 = JCM 12514]